MKYIINLSLLLLIIFAVNGCFLFGNKCKDSHYRNFTSTEENLIPYQENDSLRFVNPHTGENFIGRVTNYKFNLRDTSVHEDLYCDDQMFKVIQSRKELHLLISSEFNDEILVNMKFELFTVDYTENSKFFIHINEPVYNPFLLKFSPENEMILKDHDYSSQGIDYFDKIILKEDTFYRVFKIYDTSEGIDHSKSDTLFYSLDKGLIKLVIPTESKEFVLKK